MTFLSYLISGISLGSIYAIIALGYTMVYGIAKMLNFAHGDVIMVGAYICFFATSRSGPPPPYSGFCSCYGCVHDSRHYLSSALHTSRFFASPLPRGSDHGNRNELLSPEQRPAALDLQPEGLHFGRGKRIRQALRGQPLHFGHHDHNDHRMRPGSWLR